MPLPADPEKFDVELMRVLTSEKIEPEDYDMASYIVNSGLSDSKTRISSMRSNYGKIIDVAWLGPNAAGLDKIHELRTRGNLNNAEQVENEYSNGLRKQRVSKLFPKPDSALRTIALTVISGVLLAAVFILLSSHLGINLQ